MIIYIFDKVFEVKHFHWREKREKKIKNSTIKIYLIKGI